MTKPRLMILVAGPYRSGTHDDPVLIQKNVDAMNETALQLYNMGHLPMLGEWLALPLVHYAGSQSIGDDIFNQYFHPSSERLLSFCDAVLRIGGASSGADLMIESAKQMGKLIFHNINEIESVIF